MKVWAEFEVSDEMELEDVALALEIRFGAEGDTATVWEANPAKKAITDLYWLWKWYRDEYPDAEPPADLVGFTGASDVAGRAFQQIDFGNDAVELPRIAADDDWVMLSHGDRAILGGKLDAAVTPDSSAIVVVNTAWELFVVNVGKVEVSDYPARAEVELVVERVEDGMQLVSIREIQA